MKSEFANIVTSKTALLNRIIKPLPNPRHTVDCPFIDLEWMLDGYQKNWGGLNLEPDFQRGHVWTKAQRIAFMEGIFRGTVGENQLRIQFNAPHWEDEHHGGDLPNEIQVVDGLQRLTTVRLFIAGELRIFDGLQVGDLDESHYSTKKPCYRLLFAMHNFSRRADLLRYYLDINAGGTPHSASEIQRVRALLTDAEGLPGHQA